MNSTKDLTQKRMLNLPNQLNSPRLAKIGARSPTNSIPLSPTGKSNKTLFKNFQLPKHEQIKFTQSSKSIQNEQIYQKKPEDFNHNYQKQQLTFDNGDYYEGGINDNKMFGKGFYVFNNQKLQYFGEFYENSMHGWGVLKKKSQNQEIIIYEGGFSFNKKHGDGKYMYDGQNHYYNGQWKHDQKHGKGVYFFFDGIYNGEWKNNKMEGEGILKLNNGYQYKGQFQNGNFIKGLVRYPNGDEYSGTILNGQRHGQGSYYSYKSQQRYKGQWIDDKKHGKGTTYLQNGDEFQATFNQGQTDQTQSCTYKWNSGPDQGSVFNGWFKQGKPQKGHVSKSNGEQFDIY